MQAYNFPDNSERARNEYKRFETKQVLKNPVTVKNKTLKQKMAGLFLGSDRQAIKEYLLEDVAFPTITNFIWDAITGILSMVLYHGENRPQPKSGVPNDYTKHYTYSSSKQAVTNTPKVYRDRYTRPELREIEYATAIDADNIIELVRDTYEMYNGLTVANYIDFHVDENRKTPIPVELDDTRIGWNTPEEIASFKRVNYGRRYYITMCDPHKL